VCFNAAPKRALTCVATDANDCACSCRLLRPEKSSSDQCVPRITLLKGADSRKGAGAGRD